jgi:hypothetical protein
MTNFDENFDQDLMINRANEELKKYELLEAPRIKRIDGSLFVIAFSKCKSDKWKRYHKIVVPEGLPYFVYHNTNVAGIDHTIEFEEVKQGYLVYLVRMINKQLVNTNKAFVKIEDIK